MSVIASLKNISSTVFSSSPCSSLVGSGTGTFFVSFALPPCTALFSAFVLPRKWTLKTIKCLVYSRLLGPRHYKICRQFHGSNLEKKEIL